jgi:hypothetical protein
MEILYTWKTVKADCFTKEIQFSYGNKTSDSLDDWNSAHEDLLINVTINTNEEIAEKETYFFPGETHAMIFSWRADNRFSGSTAFFDYDFEIPFQITYIIPKGTCGSRLEAECNLVVREAAFNEGGDWLRPPGSIIGVIPIIEKIVIDKGAWFPVEEFEGDGSALLNWEFVNMDNLALSVSSCFLVLIDKKHPLVALLDSQPEGQSLLSLLIIQAFARKALTDEVYDQLKELQEKGESWMAGSAGACFDFVLSRILSMSGLPSFDVLRSLFLENPEKIDAIVDKAFTTGLISRFKK